LADASPSSLDTAGGQAGRPLLVQVGDGIATLTLNRPHRLNALSRQLREELAEALHAVGGDEGVHAIVLTGAGDRAFCVGLDLEELAAGALQADDIGPGGAMMRAFAVVRQPVIGAINGLAVTGGLELALQCDLLVASASARFADTHARVGVSPGWGLTQLLTAAVGPLRARYMHFTGNFIDAETARDWGLVLDVVPPEDLDARCIQLAREIGGCDATTLRDMRRAARLAMSVPLSEGLALEEGLALASLQRFDAAAFGRRRGAVMERGQRQSAGPGRDDKEMA